MKLTSYVADRWYEASTGFADVSSAVDGRAVAQVSSAGLDFGAAVAHARRVGGPALRVLGFHERAAILKSLATYLNDRKTPLYALSNETGATKRDNFVDIDGGIGTLFSYASKGRRELPAGNVVVEGEIEMFGKGGTFGGRHVLTALQGVAVHINAYNFPVWGMLEKFAPAFLAGVPSIVKPATATAYLTHAAFTLMIESGLLPSGCVQLIVGRTGDLLDHLDGQDVLSFTGSLETSLSLRNHPTVAEKAVRFVAERDSLNAAVLGSDAHAGTPEFDLFVTEVVREMTVKAGQKCTAIRRAIVPRETYDAAVAAITAKLATVVVGDPRQASTKMGALAGLEQRADVRANVARLRAETDLLFGDPDHVSVEGANDETGAFMSPVLLGCANPLAATIVHEVEAFGPVCTLMPYDATPDAVEIVKRGAGSLVASVYTHDAEVARALVFGIASYHGRVIVIDRDDAGESTGHGSPMPPLVHGGPGRAGGSEELGGLRGVYHYMQRTAIQGSPARLAALTGTWTPGAGETTKPEHPFRYTFEELTIGDTLHTAARTISLDDIERFAHFTGDTFYAHMNEEAAQANPFFKGRVAHGYLLLAFAAGLFVDPEPGPVLANYGLDALRFIKPVKPGDTISARLTVKNKAPREGTYGEVRWSVEIANQNGETAATYDLLTMNAKRDASAPKNGAAELAGSAAT
jgi:oxepin-CoA hydrolase/3-oxo-5,6-dehydrosuberyl-CoA semialdehyde dehydrogenase